MENGSHLQHVDFSVPGTYFLHLENREVSNRLFLYHHRSFYDLLLTEVSRTYFDRNNTACNGLSLHLMEGLEPIDADYARITQVVTNLLNNAMTHTREGEIIISLFKQEGEQIVVVSDNGEGMREEIREKVFKGYVSASKEYWRHGIGLYVCHQIIEAHGGRIWIDSILGKGTTVTFTLPERRSRE